MPRNLVPNQFDYSGIYVEGQRSQFRFNKPYQASFMSGMLVPFGDPIPVFPGTKFDLKAAMNVISNTMVVPPLDGMYLDVFFVWVPDRIVWSHHPQFLGENDTTAWTQSSTYSYPSIKYGKLNQFWSNQNGSFAQQDVSLGNFSLACHYGLIYGITPGGMPASLPAYGQDINALTFRGYYACWNHLFRDENYQRPVLWSKTDTGDSGEFGYQIRTYNIDSGKTLETNGLTVSLGVGLTSDKALLMPVNKFHDAFTSVLPQPQFGNAVGLGVGTSAPVVTSATYTPSATTTVLKFFDGTSIIGASAIGSNGAAATYGGSNPGNGTITGVNLVADLSNALGTIHQFRMNVMTQRYLEALARGGRRVPEYYEAIYNVKNTAAAKDYPELLSHERYVLGINQVVATADTEGTGWQSHLGDRGAYSLTVLRDVPGCERDFTEFGYIHILYCVRASNRYSQFIQPHFTRKLLLDDYNPYFDHIGDVSIPAHLVNTSANTSNNFGYQEAWWSERTQLAMACGAVNKHYGSLKYYTIGEDFPASLTTCTPGYLCFDPGAFNDVFVTAYYGYPQFIMDGLIYGKKVARMSQHSTPGIVGRI